MNKSKGTLTVWQPTEEFFNFITNHYKRYWIEKDICDNLRRLIVLSYINGSYNGIIGTAVSFNGKTI